MYVKTRQWGGPVFLFDLFHWLIVCRKTKLNLRPSGIMSSTNGVAYYYYMNYIATLLKRNCTVILVFSYFCLFLLYVFSIFFQLLSHL